MDKKIYKLNKLLIMNVCIIIELNVKYYFVLIFGIYEVLFSCFFVVYIFWDWCWFVYNDGGIGYINVF